MHGEFAYWADPDEQRRLRMMGYAVPKGTKQKIHELRLVVSLGKAAEVPIEAARELAGLQRDRYIFREDVEYKVLGGRKGETRHAPGFRLKAIANWQRRFFGPLTHRDEYRRHDAKRRRKSKNAEQHA